MEVFKAFLTSQSVTNQQWGIPDVVYVVAHSVAAALAGLKKKGMEVQRIHQEGTCIVINEKVAESRKPAGTAAAAKKVVKKKVVGKKVVKKKVVKRKG